MKQNYFLPLLFAASVGLTLTNCGKKTTDPAPSTPPATSTANIKPITKKPTAAPNVANNVKNEASKSVLVTVAKATTNTTKGGAKPTMAKPTGAKVTSLVSGNANARTEATTYSGWMISEVWATDGVDTICTYATNAVLDTDEDRKPDNIDIDDDNDGIIDTEDTDDDGDGVLDVNDDEDDDNDGLLDIDDLDDDNDGIQDTDDEMSIALLDTDADKILDYLDTDDDNDGILDTADMDDDGDGIDDSSEDDLDDFEEAFDFVIFFFESGEYFVYDPSESEDAWDWGYWYLGADSVYTYLATDLGDEDEELYEIKTVGTSELILSTFDEDSGLEVEITLSSVNI